MKVWLNVKMDHVCKYDDVEETNVKSIAFHKGSYHLSLGTDENGAETIKRYPTDIYEIGFIEDIEEGDD